MNANDFSQKLSLAPWSVRRCHGKSTLLIAGLLAGSLLTIGCSKENSKATGSAVVASSNPAFSSPTTAAPVQEPALRPIQPAARKLTPKKAAKKHSSVVTYKDDTYGISFAYPRKYTLKTGEDLKSDSGSISMDFVQPGGLVAVSLELPKDAFPETDLASAFFQVNVH